MWTLENIDEMSNDLLWTLEIPKTKKGKLQLIKKLNEEDKKITKRLSEEMEEEQKEFSKFMRK